MKKEIIKDPVKEMDELSAKLKNEKEKSTKADKTKKQQMTIKEKFIKY